MTRISVMYFLAVIAGAVSVASSALAQQTAFGHIVSLQTGSLGGPPHLLRTQRLMRTIPWLSRWTHLL